MIASASPSALLRARPADRLKTAVANASEAGGGFEHLLKGFEDTGAGLTEQLGSAAEDAAADPGSDELEQTATTDDETLGDETNGAGPVRREPDLSLVMAWLPFTTLPRPAQHWLRSADGQREAGASTAAPEGQSSQKSIKGESLDAAAGLPEFSQPTLTTAAGAETAATLRKGKAEVELSTGPALSVGEAAPASLSSEQHLTLMGSRVSGMSDGPVAKPADPALPDSPSHSKAKISSAKGPSASAAGRAAEQTAREKLFSTGLGGGSSATTLFTLHSVETFMDPAGGLAASPQRALVQAGVASPVIVENPAPLSAAAQDLSQPSEVLKVIRFQLQPAHLGTVQVSLRLKKGELQAHLQVSTARAGEMIQRDHALLNDILERSGYRLEDQAITVTVVPHVEAQEQPSARSGQHPSAANDDGHQTSQQRHQAERNLTPDRPTPKAKPNANQTNVDPTNANQSNVESNQRHSRASHLYL